MDKNDILELLSSVKEGTVSPEDALLKFKAAPFDDLDFAKIDNHRQLRQGVCEVIYGQSKSAEQIYSIVSHMADNGSINVLITRIDSDKARQVEALGLTDSVYDEDARILVVKPRKPEGRGSIVIVSAGTSDYRVCAEARVTAEYLGNNVIGIYDAGVAGLHRLLSKLDIIQSARCVIAVAGMEGALASVVGGLVDCPCIAVPTSIGYGASFGGLSALLSMLNSCASGVSVVNIDNGFGAGYLASMINHMESI